jgi:DNA polymerase-1
VARKPARPLLAADTPYLMYRSFFALPKSIKGATGAPVNALLGSINALVQAVEEHDPRAVVLCFGQDAADYRVDLFPGYHADRPPMPDELAAQWNVAPELFEMFGWTVYERPGYEADDVLGSLARAEEKRGGEALLMTGDRDMYQCVGDCCRVLYVGGRGKGPEVIDAKEVEQRYGVPPALVPDLIALRGDPSDGIPGARGIGPKTAAELLRRHGSLEAALESPLGESKRVMHALREQAEELRAYKDVATLQALDIPAPPDAPTDWAAGAAAAEAFGMNALSRRLAGIAKARAA